MSRTSIAGFALICAIAASGAAPIPLLGSLPVEAQELPLEKKIELLSKNKDQIGTGDMLRRFFYGDLIPISVQPGGANMVVNLYNKANDYTFSFCTTYDVVVAVKKGKVMEFTSTEVK